MKTILSHTLCLAMAAMLVGLAILMTGCADDADLVIPDAAKSSLPFAATPDILMENFHLAYGSQDLASYAAMLHPDYEFERHGGGTYDREVELKIAARMFSGEDYVKPGCTIAGVSKIEIDVFEGLGEWAEVSARGREVLGRTYQVKIRFLRTDGGVLSVDGQTRFEVVLDELAGPRGESRDGWRILRQVDGT